MTKEGLSSKGSKPSSIHFVKGQDSIAPHGVPETHGNSKIPHNVIRGWSWALAALATWNMEAGSGVNAYESEAARMKTDANLTILQQCLECLDELGATPTLQ